MQGPHLSFCPEDVKGKNMAVNRFVYRGQKRQALSFPLGGIGTGCIGLSGTGRLCDWEIFNRPNIGSMNGYSHFGIKVERDGVVLDGRVLNADLMPPYMGQITPNTLYSGFGFGPSRFLMSGLPHFRSCTFTGEFPFARIGFEDETFPGHVALNAFNPFIPLDEDSSSIPAAFFSIELENTQKEALDYTVEMSVSNPSQIGCEHLLINDPDMTAITLSSISVEKDSTDYGSVIMAVPGGQNVSFQQYWYRGSWYDNLSIFWQDFLKPGRFQNREYKSKASVRTKEDTATLAVHVRLEPSEKKTLRFLIGWHYPNCHDYWASNPALSADIGRKGAGGIWKNHYALLFPDVLAVARHSIEKWDTLYGRTKMFHDALYSSTLPEEALDALAANLSTLKSPTCLRLSDGSLYAFEGCHSDAGSCEGNCAHVWNYAFALPFLFPRLERSLRELEYTYNLREDGGLTFRLQLPLGSERSRFRPCVDGQMGGVIKTYREWKISGDDEWMKAWWPSVKKSLEFIWSQQNTDKWDPDKTGVITGRQHHTLDMELFGPNAWLNAMYLAALKAAARMARRVGDLCAAEEYEQLFKKGQAFTDTELFNGEYYFQRINLSDLSILEAFSAGESLTGKTTLHSYWNTEAEEIKYQIGEGCGIDQVLAQWMADFCGLGDILDEGQVLSALKSIYQYNYFPSLRFHVNPCRVYGLNDEAGTVVCTWPTGRKKPVVAVPYAEETMHGMEYQTASHMIKRGMISQGLDLVRAVRDRYDGEKRNPWNEFECGSHYARSLSSYALLLAFSGFQYDMTELSMGFAPVVQEGQQKFFWSLHQAWGVFTMADGCESLSVCEGKQKLSRFITPNARDVKRVLLNDEIVSFEIQGDAVCFASPLELNAGSELTLS